jgi:hypothetical protein
MDRHSNWRTVPWRRHGDTRPGKQQGKGGGRGVVGAHRVS